MDDHHGLTGQRRLFPCCVSKPEKVGKVLLNISFKRSLHEGTVHRNTCLNVVLMSPEWEWKPQTPDLEKAGETQRVQQHLRSEGDRRRFGSRPFFRLVRDQGNERYKQ